jgi:hypothetical protein
MLQNKILVLFLLFFNFMFGQQKIDTIYVYEEVIVHDTLYIEKELKEIKIDKATLTKGKDDEKMSVEVMQNGKKLKIKLDTIIGIDKKQIGDFQKKKSWFFGVKFHFATSENSFFKSLKSSNNIGIGLGIWTKKQLFDSNFSLGIGLDGLYWSSPFSFDASQNESVLNGYYFTDSKKPILFKGIDNKYFQVQIPLQFNYKFKKFSPSFGVFASISNYKSEFIVSSGKLPLSLDETQIFEAQALQMGYLAELQYEVTKHMSVSLNFSSGNSKNLIFTNKNDKSQILKTNNSFQENKFSLTLIYSL